MTTNPRKIPIRVVAVAAHSLSEYGSNKQIDRWLRLAEVPSAALSGGSNKEQKVQNALDILNKLQSHRALDALGVMLSDLIESKLLGEEALQWRQEVIQALAEQGLRYVSGGRIIGQELAPTVSTFEQEIRSRNWGALDTEYQRAFEGIKDDPPEAVTAACAILESLCTIYIEAEKLELPKTQTLQSLWPIVQRALGLDPAGKEDNDLKAILQGLASVATGIAHFRTHTGSAHGRGLDKYRVQARHAHLAVGAAHTLAKFLTETWDARRARASSS